MPPPIPPFGQEYNTGNRTPAASAAAAAANPGTARGGLARGGRPGWLLRVCDVACALRMPATGQLVSSCGFHRRRPGPAQTRPPPRGPRPSPKKKGRPALPPVAFGLKVITSVARKALSVRRECGDSNAQPSTPKVATLSIELRQTKLKQRLNFSVPILFVQSMTVRSMAFCKKET